MSISEKKKIIRAEFLEKRRKLDERSRKAASRVITGKLRDLGRRFGWNLISCYLDFDAEVQTFDYVRQSIEEGKRIAVPYVDPVSRRLYFSEVIDLQTETIINQYGIREPKRQYLRLIPPGGFDVVIVPGTAFDKSGNRLGFGLGFYDRFLQDIQGRIPLVGLAFSQQITDNLPVEKHDVPMNMILTEEGIYLPEGKKPSILEAVSIEEVL